MHNQVKSAHPKNVVSQNIIRIVDLSNHHLWLSKLSSFLCPTLNCKQTFNTAYGLFAAEAPEEEYDPRSLFERLEANRIKKQEEFDEAHRLSQFAACQISTFRYSSVSSAMRHLMLFSRSNLFSRSHYVFSQQTLAVSSCMK